MVSQSLGCLVKICLETYEKESVEVTHAPMYDFDQISCYKVMNSYDMDQWIGNLL